LTHETVQIWGRKSQFRCVYNCYNLG